ncbi:MAG: very short patch repair endonuclease [Methylotenera sp.]
MTDRVSKEIRSKIMRKVKSKNTKPELLIRKILTTAGYRYRLHVKDLPGKPDIVFKKRRRVLFVHGCFWHGHAECSRGTIADSEFWRIKIKSNMDRDEKTLSKLAENGWQCLIIWECELKNIDFVKSKIFDFLGSPSLARHSLE